MAARRRRTPPRDPYPTPDRGGATGRRWRDRNGFCHQVPANGAGGRDLKPRQNLDRLGDRIVMIANEKAVCVDVISVRQVTVDIMREETHDFAAGEVSGYDGATFEAFFEQLCYEIRARDPGVGAQNQRKAEPA